MNAPTIIFEDTHLLVLSKPAGLLSQGDISESENVVDWCREHFGRHYVGLVHRLDRNTSGLMVVGKRTKSAARLTKALQDRTLIRRYKAWVWGKVTEPRTWTHHLWKDEKQNKMFVDETRGKKSVLHLTPLQESEYKGECITLCAFKLDTGRNHQIRVQAAYEGNSLLGDRKYGNSLTDADFPRPLLHSVYLEFPHPMSHEVLTFEDELPADMKL